MAYATERNQIWASLDLKMYERTPSESLGDSCQVDPCAFTWSASLWSTTYSMKYSIAHYFIAFSWISNQLVAHCLIITSWTMAITSSITMIASLILETLISLNSCPYLDWLIEYKSCTSCVLAPSFCSVYPVLAWWAKASRCRRRKR